ILKPTNVQYVYTLIKKGDDIFFVLDTPEPDDLANNRISGPLDKYDDASDAVFSAFKSTTAVFDEYTDEWGHFRSVFLPHTTQDGITYLACADIPIDHIESELKETLRDSIGLGLLIFALSSLTTYLLVNRFFAPVALAQRVIKQVASERNLTLR